MHQWFPVSMRKLCVKAISLSWSIRTHHDRTRSMDCFTRAVTSWETSLSANPLFAMTPSALVTSMVHRSRSPTTMGVEHCRRLFPQFVLFQQVPPLSSLVLSHSPHKHNRRESSKYRRTNINHSQRSLPT